MELKGRWSPTTGEKGVPKHLQWLEIGLWGGGHHSAIYRAGDIERNDPPPPPPLEPICQILWTKVTPISVIKKKRKEKLPRTQGDLKNNAKGKNLKGRAFGGPAVRHVSVTHETVFFGGFFHVTCPTPQSMPSSGLATGPPRHSTCFSQERSQEVGLGSAQGPLCAAFPFWRGVVPNGQGDPSPGKTILLNTCCLLRSGQARMRAFGNELRA